MPSGIRNPRRGVLLGLLCLFVSTLLAACSSQGPRVPGNLLYGLSPTRVEAVTNVDRLTDGTIAPEGDDWDTDVTSIFRTQASTVEWDLGKATRVRAIYLQGDNNDEFFFSASEDGKSFLPIWSARFVPGAGMRARYTKGLDVPARYLRLTMKGGDPAVSASEVEVFDAVPDPFPPALREVRGKKPVHPGEVESLVFGLVAGAALLLHRSSSAQWKRVLWIAATIAVFLWALDAVLSEWPPRQPVVDAVRAISAAVAGAAVLRMAWRPADLVPRFVTVALAAMAFVALTTFYNMWQPQFEDAADGRNTWVHTWDMRVYFPTAKYFDELGFDGLYLASVEAYLEDVPGADERRIARVELRDLRTYEMTTVQNVISDVHTVRNRFSPERWLEFKRDMAYFWRTMGPGGYLGSLRDHGGNATPAWLLVAHLMFRHASATEGNLLLAALLDPLLLAIFFVAVWRTFDLRTALVCLTIYGASTFPWFGSNWAGSTLRNDWMVSVGLGACALRAGRPATGGALLANAAMIRAFPAVSVLFLVVPAVWWMVEVQKREGRLPAPRRILVEQAPLFRALAGAAVTVVALGLVSGLVFGFRHSWGDWSHKIAMHSVSPNVNHVGLRTLFAWDPDKTLRGLSRSGGGDWAAEQIRTFQRRKPLFVTAVAAFSLLAIGAARGRDLRQAALIGMMLIPIFFYPSNYYLHYVFVLPLLVDYSEEERARRLWALVSVVMLGVCVSEYFGFEPHLGVDERYVQWSVGALAGYLVILVALLRDAQPKPTQETERAGAAETAA